MAEEGKPGLQLSFGQLHLTATVALLASVVGGFYTAVSWVNKIQNISEHNEEELVEISQRIDGLNKVINAFNERNGSNDNDLHQQIFQLQQQLTEISSHMQQIYQPDVPLRRTRR
jgi:hypothetical protein